MILVNFRFDDPSPVSNHELEKKIISIFAKYEMQLCVGIVPFHEENGERISFKKNQIAHLTDAYEKGVLEVCQHGYSHTLRSKTIDGSPSEFVGLPEEDQHYYISEGLKELSNNFRKINGFIPPWNTYDCNTEKILKNLGFTFVSANCDSPHPTSHFLPNLYRTSHMKHAKNSLKRAYLYQELNPLVNILFHHYDFKENKGDKGIMDLNQLDDLLGWIQNKEDITTIPLNKAANLLEKITSNHNIRYHQFLVQLPKSIQWHFPNDIIFLSSRWEVVRKLAIIQMRRFFGKFIGIKI